MVIRRHCGGTVDCFGEGQGSQIDGANLLICIQEYYQNHRLDCRHSRRSGGAEGKRASSG